jgi:hypothetical protein
MDQSKQTAMKALWDYIDANCHEENFNIQALKEESIQKEKQQIIDAALELNPGNIPPKLVKELAEQYYNETYNK